VYQPLYKYLENRYATTVKLRLSEIEDIVGFALPASARTDRAWWTVADPSTSAGAYRGAWTSAQRMAVPNFLAGTVVFSSETSRTLTEVPELVQEAVTSRKVRLRI
jgi:hypothetical protein